MATEQTYIDPMDGWEEVEPEKRARGKRVPILEQVAATGHSAVLSVKHHNSDEVLSSFSNREDAQALANQWAQTIKTAKLMGVKTCARGKAGVFKAFAYKA